MFGFIFGTLCLMGLFALKATAYRGRRHWGRRSYRGTVGTGHHRSARRGRGVWASAGAEMLKRRLDLDEDQGDLADHAFADAQRSVKEFMQSLRDSRGELAAAVRQEALDDARLEVVFDRLDDELRRTRREVVSAVKQVHATLDDAQRERAAEWIGGDARWV